MTTRQLQKWADEFRIADNVQRESIVRKAWESYGADGIEGLAYMLRVDPLHLASAFGLRRKYIRRVIRREYRSRYGPRERKNPGYSSEARELARSAGGGQSWVDSVPLKRYWEPLSPTR
ncbi:hypothetical protein Sulac_0375 [Sulfobacillus acidophilus DSM 10332]|uniref:Uncharacterized protein n=1 Tax=Sulfobacillus acidophilus (strain ATCC 700253 / DSM 10332 / NAL) TaxID=679936 RepID=G8TY36_SULAD|nr:hypothetical protein Sulac_0375 [Sulfobacillus acidophilus DSM 10332]